MKCPFCPNSDTAIVDSREADEGAVIRRRRRCLSCDKRFTTYERVELRMPVLVKKNGARVDYDREKLRSSFKLALRKRDVSSDKVDDAILRVEEKLIGTAEREPAFERRRVPFVRTGGTIRHRVRGRVHRRLPSRRDRDRARS